MRLRFGQQRIKWETVLERRFTLTDSDPLLWRWLLAGLWIASSREATAATIAVSTTNDAPSACAMMGLGTCSFRDAITFANHNPGADAIEFNIGFGPQTIKPLSPLPPITDTLYIRGWTQPGSGPTRIELDGSLAGPGADGLQILAGRSGVSSLSIYGFDGNAIRITGGGGSTVSSCFLGVDRNGTLARRNRGAGVLISSSANNRIGEAQQLRNVIAGNQDGVRIEGTGSDGNFLLYNLVGVNYSASVIGNLGAGIIVLSGLENVIGGGAIFGSGSSGLILGPSSAGAIVQAVGIGGVYVGAANANDGILINGSVNNLIGGVYFLSTANQIVRNGGYGIHITNGANGNLVIGNYIGTDSTIFSLGNIRGGIRIENSSGNVLGGDFSHPNIIESHSAAANFIAFNHGPGISVEGSSGGNMITRNAIMSNTGLGIDLGSDGVTPNQAGTSVRGPNDLQNYPILTRATSGRAGTSVEGTINSRPGGSIIVEFFSSPDCHGPPPNDFGEGRVFLGATRVATNGSGDASFAVLLSQPVPAGQVVTATATDLGGNTSEFCQCKTVAAASLNESDRPPQTRVVPPRPGGL